MRKSGAKEPTPNANTAFVGIAEVFVFAFGLFYLACSFYFSLTERNEHLIAQFILLTNGCVALWAGYLCLRRRYPLLLIVFYFDFLFFAVAPLQQIAGGWIQYYGIDSSVTLGAILSFCFVSLGWTAFGRRSHAQARSPEKPGIFYRDISESASSGLYLLIAVIAISIVIVVALYGQELFTSREARSELVSEALNKQLAIILYAYFQPFLVIGSAIGCAISFRRDNKIQAALFAVLLLGAFVVNNPLITSRFRLASLLVFCLLTFARWNNTRALLAFLLVGILVSPVLNTLRFNRAVQDNRSFFGFFAHVDYDAFSIVCRSIDYVATNGTSKGSNLLSAVLFFVPRSIWKDKSDHMTKIMFPYLHEEVLAQTDNLSSPPIAEGYFAFGIFGGVAVSIIVLMIVLMIERRAAKAAKNSTWYFVACLSPILLLITLRGPLIVGISESVGNSFALLTAIGLTGAFRIFRGAPTKVSLAGRRPAASIKYENNSHY